MTATTFVPSTHGLKFANFWPPGTPDLIVHTGFARSPSATPTQACAEACASPPAT